MFINLIKELKKMKTEGATLENIKKGYSYDRETDTYTCGICGEKFESGEIYQINGHFYDAARAIEKHIGSGHADYLDTLIFSDSKYNTLTDNQKQLFRLFASGLPDKEIARQLNVSTSTVRHQKFMFREKAKQARQYLAVYESVFEGASQNASTLMPIHDNARMVDQRYVITEEERVKILQTSFASLEPLKLNIFPHKEKKKVVILSRIAEEFRPGVEYSEKEVNAIIGAVFDDYVTIRRYMIEYGFLGRKNDGSKYWLTA